MHRFGRFARSLEDLPDGANVSFDVRRFVVRPLL
jgi:hypothetical protein